jgi:hypothetical protein
MKLNSAQVEQTLTQFEAQVIPDDHPLVPKLNECSVTTRSSSTATD